MSKPITNITKLRKIYSPHKFYRKNSIVGYWKKNLILENWIENRKNLIEQTTCLKQNE